VTLSTRPLGATGVPVTAIGLGCMSASWAYRLDPQDDDTSVATIGAALDHGVTHLDTASMYGPHHNERLVGRAIRGRRESVFLASKAGLVVDDPVQRVVTRDGRPETLLRTADESLERLGTDVIDLYYLHRVDPAVPVEESWGALSSLVTAGKVRHLGLSECGVDELARAHAIHPVAALQSELSPWTRDPIRDGQLGWCRANGAAFVAFGVLGRGFLTGKLAVGTAFPVGDFRRTNPRFTPAAMTANGVLVETIARIAADHDALPAQVLVAWALAQGPHVLAIPGTKRVGYLTENVGGDGLQLTADDLATIDALPAAVGARYG
jgi:aryl-alcohol dehydrogenase-like predicted oxidoreductase